MTSQFFDVTQDHINYGEQDKQTQCAVACAAREFFRDKRVRVDIDLLEVDYGYRTHRYRVSDPLRRWIIDFDFDKDLVEPITIEIVDDGEERYNGMLYIAGVRS